MHNIKSNFDKILVVIKDILGDEINEKVNYLRRGTRPRFADIEVIALIYDISTNQWSTATISFKSRNVTAKTVGNKVYFERGVIRGYFTHTCTKDF